MLKKRNVLVDIALTTLEALLVKIARKHLALPPDDTQKITEALKLLHALFGPRVKITLWEMEKDDYEIHVECRNCERQNRITRGFKNSVCGACKKPLVVGAVVSLVN